jgi:hypothetical protein
MQMFNRAAVLSDPSIEVNFVGWDVSEPDVLRLERQVLRVWEKIPTGDRIVFRRYWTEEMLHHKPRLELQGGWIGDPCAMATTESKGAEIKFDWPTCKQLPDELLQVVIAHEMGHVFHWAIGKHRFNMTREDLLKEVDFLPLRLCDNALVELFADQKAEQWGYDCVLKDAYMVRFFDHKDGKIVTRKRPRNEKRAYNLAKQNRNWSLYKIPVESTQ